MQCPVCKLEPTPAERASGTCDCCGMKLGSYSPERREQSSETKPAYPTTVTIAGIVWMIYGGLILLNLLLSVGVLLPGSGQAHRIDDGDRIHLAALGCSGALILLIGIFGVGFFVVGLQSVRGTARDTLGNSIGSIILGLICFGLAAIEAHIGHMIGAGITFLVGVGLVAAGVLALTGRAAYKRWRKAEIQQWGEC
jgi:hypothetical protein